MSFGLIVPRMLFQHFLPSSARRPVHALAAAVSDRRTASRCAD
jgi:hypothetical protein